MALPDGRFLPVNSERSSTQLLFEKMLNQFDGQNEVIVDGGEIGEGMSQKMFVRKGNGLIPSMGAEITSSEGVVRYSLTFFMGSPSAYGKVMVAENRLESRNGRRGIEVPAVMSGAKGEELIDLYDANIVQAASNHFGQEILHTVDTANKQESYKSKVELQGYSPRKGYPETYDKFYRPQR